MALSKELGIKKTRFLRSSSLKAVGTKSDRLICILRRLGATVYISGPSARNYLEEWKFEGAGIAVEYMAYEYPEYPQLHGTYSAQVSVLDLLFMVGPEAPRYIW
jgi:hypothetical protein